MKGGEIAELHVGRSRQQRLLEGRVDCGHTHAHDHKNKSEYQCLDRPHPFVLIYTAQRYSRAFKSPSSRRAEKSWSSAKVTALCSLGYVPQAANLRAVVYNSTETADIVLCNRTPQEYPLSRIELAEPPFALSPVR